jgi:hypothetical protein
MAQQTDLRILSREEATTVVRPDRGPWTWPELVYVAIGNCYSLIGNMNVRALNGGPLEMELAANFITSLYDAGYVIAKAGEAR